ncbi:MAG: hypothetical protein KDJ29_12335 [Hyphomicrobiales bacterium]|nr:hypothetical protein [Hyphomicrobiales bacterium]
MKKSVVAVAGAIAVSLLAQHANAASGYTVNLQMSPASSRLLSGMGEKVTVWASYEGEGKRGVKTDPMGMVNLGNETRIVSPRSQKVQMSGKFNERLARRSLKGEPQLLINVYSARKAHQNNLLNCGIWQNPVRMAPPGFTIRCKLIQPDATGAR